MFGMSSKEFWEEDPQLYWAYRTFYLKKLQIESEEIDYKSWSNGNYNFLAFSIALNNAFSDKKLEYPKKPYCMEEKSPKSKLQKELEKISDKNIKQQTEFNFWARL